MANRSLKFCAHTGCDELVTFGYCETEAKYLIEQLRKLKREIE